MPHPLTTTSPSTANLHKRHPVQVTNGSDADSNKEQTVAIGTHTLYENFFGNNRRSDNASRDSCKIDLPLLRNLALLFLYYSFDVFPSRVCD